MTIERHSRARKIELGQELLGRRKVYLDTRYWIILRETAAARRTDAASRKLLHFLRRGVNAGRLICPISADLFMELTKQANTPTRRQATARLIDELSLGVTSMDPQTLLATEAHRFLSAALHGEEAVHPMQELIWTKVAYALGDMYPKLDGAPPEDQLELQKRVFDHLWETPLSDLVAGMDDGTELRRDYTELTRDTNARNQEHRDELRSYENAYDVELRGAVEVVGEIAADIIAEMEARTTGSRPDPSPEQRAASVNMCRNLVYHAMRRPENRSAMRTLHVKASIHATMRWDKERRFKANDWHDFGHATFALTYCDAFLTEGPLRHLVTSRGSGLEDINGCRVASSADDALAIVRKILEDG
ncbi:hypothetical protein [Sphingomonas sp. Leaf198]|uniref:hypothetical protein n=1 Tax=Sphingomonas sp. Leaf198 TaxID=1736299 RepID=UPI0006F567F1|nr:hypothetical protein [Sphingomonas sp. Leaf198]KQS51289.1 hypothetical protein ASG20_04410 [Sphingomonas sp. Leaf198]